MADIVIPERTENIYTVKPATSLNNKFSGTTIPQNPGLAPNNFNGGHQDSYCSESVSLWGPTGSRLKAIVQLNPYGFAPIMAANASGQLISMSYDLPGVFTLITFDEDCTITSATPAGTHVVSLSDITFAGGYFFLDKDDNSIVTIENRLKCYPTANVEKKSEVYKLEPLWRSEDVVALVTEQNRHESKGNSLYSALPVWDEPKSTCHSQLHLYWCLISGEYDKDKGELKSPAYMAVVQVDPTSKPKISPYSPTEVLASLPIPDGWNNNTFAVTEKGAFFVTNNIDKITGKCDKGYLWAVAYDSAKKTISVRWKYSYENSGYLKVGQQNIGSGTTPTVTQTTDGKTLVSITDNAYPQMRVVVVNDADGSLYSQVPVFPKMRGCDEASLIGVQDRIIVENNFGHTVSAIRSQLVANEPGFAMIQVPASASGASDVVWEDKHHSMFAMSMLARESGIIFAFTGDFGDPESATKGGEYFITAMDSWDGRVIWRIPVGRGRPYTHEYGGMYFNRKGDKIYVGTNRFLVSVQDIGSSED